MADLLFFKTLFLQGLFFFAYFANPLMNGKPKKGDSKWNPMRITL